MFVMNLMSHNEIWKKEVPNCWERPFQPSSDTISDSAAQILGSSLDLDNNQKLKEEKQKDFPQNQLKINTNDNKETENQTKPNDMSISSTNK